MPIEQLCAPEVQDLVAYRFAKAMSDLERTRNPEKRKRILGRMSKAMFVLGRWSLLVVLLSGLCWAGNWSDNSDVTNNYYSGEDYDAM